MIIIIIVIIIINLLIVICWNVSLRTPVFMGHLHSGTPNLVAERRPHNLCIYYLY